MFSLAEIINLLVTLQISKYASGLTEQHVRWRKWEFDKVQCEVVQGHRQPAKSLAVGWIQARKWSLLKQHPGCLHSIFIFQFYHEFLLSQKERKNHVQMFSASVFFCVLAQGMDTEGTAGRLQGCLISLTIPSQAHGGGKWCWRGHWGRVGKKIGAKCGGFRYLSRGSVSLGESQCTAWLPDQLSSQVLHTHNGKYRVL